MVRWMKACRWKREEQVLNPEPFPGLPAQGWRSFCRWREIPPPDYHYHRRSPAQVFVYMLGLNSFNKSLRGHGRPPRENNETERGMPCSCPLFLPCKGAGKAVEPPPAAALPFLFSFRQPCAFQPKRGRKWWHGR